uniref:Serine acetyltransferase n=1 Tax=Gloeothece verrucosa (strain PCC 7822) TaxID=497965 RepID=E0UH08_GLOV7|nr:serine O-acetyltransferase [Gloeothece verrucosa]ADN15607.1 serine O-acetyltransferase [Gloeothece verrucosa PCC 7822]
MFGLISLEANRHHHRAAQTKSAELVPHPTESCKLGAGHSQIGPQSGMIAKDEDTCPKESFLSQIPKAFSNIAQTLRSDFQIIFERDPAARNWLEVLCCYPGLHALVLHRLAHGLHQQKIPFFPRFISHLARFFTGIEIHPGATIGRGVFIDHGMGVVIGETAIVGDYCLIYQNVTLGGTGKETGKRHPTLGNHVIVGTGAKVLGNIEIGSQVRIGAGSIVLRNVPSDCTVVGIPGRIISRKEHAPLEHGKLPDVEASVIRSLLDRIEQLEQKLQNFVGDSTILNSRGEKPQGITPTSVESIFSQSLTSEQEFLICELPKEFLRDNSQLQENYQASSHSNSATVI